MYSKYFAALILTAFATGSLVASAAQAQAVPPAGKPVPPPAQQPPAGTLPVVPGATPIATPPPAVPSSRKFTSDAGIMFSLIKPDRTVDFEAVLAKVKQALDSSQDPKRKQQALTWRVFKGLEAGPGGTVVYVWFIEPPVKDTEYVITEILTEAFPDQAQDLWAKYRECFATGQTMLNLQQVLNMSPNAVATVPK